MQISILCTVERAANSGAQSYFSERITFMEPQGSAHIITVTEAVSGVMEVPVKARYISSSITPGSAIRRINEIR